MSNLLRLFMNAAIFFLSLIISCNLLSYPSNDVNVDHPRGKPYAESSISDINYAGLQRALHMYEQAAQNPWRPLPDNIRFKPGARHSAVLQLRARLVATQDLPSEQDLEIPIYDKVVTQAVKHFQMRHGLNPDGIVGPETLFELNVSPMDRLQQIKINLQRWSKLSEELNDRYILVNIPAFQLDLIEHGQRVLTMKAVVGKPTRQTPEIYSTITRVVFNPYWNIPKMIAQQDIIPKIINNPDYLYAMNIHILDKQTSEPYEISPDEIDWHDALEQGFQFHFRQDPGYNNALGLVKFEFQNSDDIYMHDTPAKNLFSFNRRAYSSGCIRLEKPFDLVNYLMYTDPEWNPNKLQDYVESGKTRYVRAANPTKVIITYITAWADDAGNMHFRDDIYGLDNTIY